MDHEEGWRAAKGPDLDEPIGVELKLKGWCVLIFRMYIEDGAPSQAAKDYGERVHICPTCIAEDEDLNEVIAEREKREDDVSGG